MSLGTPVSDCPPTADKSTSSGVLMSGRMARASSVELTVQAVTQQVRTSRGVMIGRFRVRAHGGLISITMRRPRGRHPSVSPAPSGQVQLDAVGTSGGSESAVVRLPSSYAGLWRAQPDSFVGLLSRDGTLLDAGHKALDAIDLGSGQALGRPIWQASPWSWSPVVQQRLQDAVERAVAGEIIEYQETARIRGNKLITIDFRLVPLVEGAFVIALVASALDVSRPSTASEQTRRGAAVDATCCDAASRSASPSHHRWHGDHPSARPGVGDQAAIAGLVEIGRRALPE